MILVKQPYKRETCRRWFTTNVSGVSSKLARDIMTQQTYLLRSLVSGGSTSRILTVASETESARTPTLAQFCYLFVTLLIRSVRSAHSFAVEVLLWRLPLRLTQSPYGARSGRLSCTLIRYFGPVCSIHIFKSIFDILTISLQDLKEMKVARVGNESLCLVVVPFILRGDIL